DVVVFSLADRGGSGVCLLPAALASGARARGRCAMAATLPRGRWSVVAERNGLHYLGVWNVAGGGPYRLRLVAIERPRTSASVRRWPPAASEPPHGGSQPRAQWHASPRWSPRSAPRPRPLAPTSAPLRIQRACPEATSSSTS